MEEPIRTLTCQNICRITACERLFTATVSGKITPSELLQPCQGHGKPTVFYCVKNNRAILDKIYSEKVEVEDSHHFLFRAPKAAVPDHEDCHRIYQPPENLKAEKSEAEGESTSFPF